MFSRRNVNQAINLLLIFVCVLMISTMAYVIQYTKVCGLFPELEIGSLFVFVFEIVYKILGGEYGTKCEYAQE